MTTETEGQNRVTYSLFISMKNIFKIQVHYITLYAYQVITLHY